MKKLIILGVVVFGALAIYFNWFEAKDYADQAIETANQAYETVEEVGDTVTEVVDQMEEIKKATEK